jgi:sporulation protein YlmC with PRC-barrel domain
MKKYLIVALLAITMFFPSAGVFAQKENGSVKKGIAAGVPEDEHINAFRVDKIIDSGVINLEGKPIGTINDLVIDIDTGGVVYAVLEFGGFLGFGDKLFAVPWQSLSSVPAEGIFILDQSEAKLQKAPGFDKDNWPDVGDKSWGAGIYEFYRYHKPTPRITAVPETPTKEERQRGYRTYPGYTTDPYPYSSVWDNVYGELFNPGKIETVSGKIVKVKYYDELRLIIYTDAKKPVLVALGPIDYFAGQNKVLKPGDTVTVTGAMITVDDTPLMIATKIREGNEEMQVRDNEGHPIWLGWKEVK